MSILATLALAAVIFAALVLAYGAVMSLRAAWERLGARGTGRTIGRIAAIGGHDKPGRN